MKRIFIYCFAMFLAVGLVTSCGGKKEAAKGGAGELAKELTVVLKSATDGLEKAETGNDVVAVINKLIDDEAAVVANYPEEAKSDFEMMAEDEFNEAHPNEGPAYFEAHSNFVNKLYDVENLIEDEAERQQMWEKRHTAKVI